MKSADEIFYEVFKVHNCYHFPELKKLVELCMSEYAAQQKSEWVPVSEWKKERGKRMLCYNETTGWQVCYMDNRWQWRYSYNTVPMPFVVTHVQDLPELPSPPKK